MIKAILFDMDGVLIDAKEWHYEALNKALNLFGMAISRYDHLTTFDGLPTRRKLEMLSMDNYLPRTLHPFIAELKQQYTMDAIALNCRPAFQHEYALSKLHQEGYKIAVCSNSIRRTIETMMERAGLSSYIDAILSNEDVTRPKPDPEIYLTAMKRLGFQCNECLVVEDNVNGIKAGEASGAYVMKVATVDDVTYWNIKDAISDARAKSTMQASSAQTAKDGGNE